MNQLIVSGKVSRISPNPSDDIQGIILEHFPDNINDTYFEISFLIPLEIWKKYEIKQYDRLVLKAHLITMGRNEDNSKIKQLRIVDEIVEWSPEEW